MWSVWSERVNVYLGTGLVMVQRHGTPVWRFDPPVTLPLADVLHHVDQALDRARARPWRLHVHLSASLCPAVSFSIPPGVKRHREMLAIAKASALQVWGMATEQADEVVCSLDNRYRGLAAGMLAGTHQLISKWACRHKGQLASLQPLWAVASTARACSDKKTHGFALLEPDSLTVLRLNQQSMLSVLCLPGRFKPGEATIQMAEANAKMSVTGLSQSVIMCFDQEPVGVPWRDAPLAWSGHWRALA